MKQLFALALFTFAFPAFAETPVTGEALRTLLSGNTARGEWFGDPYLQWFGEDGSTIYAPRSTRSTLGRWRVSEDGSQYESQWGGGPWEGYGVIERDGVYYWTSPDGEAQSFTIEPGQVLTW